MRKIKICTLEALQTKGKMLFDFANDTILLSFSNNKVFASSNICPHAKGHLINGRVEDDESITCLNHGICFDLNTGKVKIDKLENELAELIDDEDDIPFDLLPIYKTEIINGDIYIVL